MTDIPTLFVQEMDYYSLPVEIRLLYEPDPIHPDRYKLRQTVPWEEIPEELRKAGKPYRVDGKVGRL